MSESPEERNRDLGFGTVVARESRLRLLNPDGTFNVQRTGLSFGAAISAYHHLITISWPNFFVLFVAAYTGINALFGIGYVLCGPDALTGNAGAVTNPFLRGFFFSVQTFSTVGYGGISPSSLSANILVAVESMFALLGFALGAGILFARFSRPTARIVFSRNAIIAPYQDKTAFEFRIANQRKNQIIDLEAKVLFSRFEREDGTLIRRFYPLQLERQKVVFFPLSWTIVHPIDEMSPLYGKTDQDLRESHAEFLILLTGVDEIFSQSVHTRSSYKADELVWNARFSDVFVIPKGDEPLKIDIGRISEFTRL